MTYLKMIVTRAERAMRFESMRSREPSAEAGCRHGCATQGRFCPPRIGSGAFAVTELGIRAALVPSAGEHPEHDFFETPYIDDTLIECGYVVPIDA